MKERFTTEEWQELRVIPVVSFYLVAGADGNVDKDEVTAFIKQVTMGAALKDELHRELAVDIASDLEGSLKAAEANVEGHVERAKAILSNKLSVDEYQKFIGSLFISGMKVAAASGGTSQEEKVALGAFAAVWGLDPSSLKKHFG
jgi:tellurite resistance protein